MTSQSQGEGFRCQGVRCLMTVIFRHLITVCLSPASGNISNQARFGAPPFLDPC